MTLVPLEDQIIQDILQVPIGLITRARAKHFREALNGLMRGFWSQAQNNLDQIGPSLDPTLVHLVHVKNEFSNGLEVSIHSL
ncbi:hypothetical protein V6Z11_D05G306100 [Gossypium hirsutum]